MKDKLVEFIKKIDTKYIVIVTVVLIFLGGVVITSLGIWFNNKLNKVESEIFDNINGKTITKTEVVKISKYKYGDLLKYQENYNPTKQYFDYYGTLVYSKAPLDDNGIRLVKNNDIFVYNPVSIAQYGLDQYSHYVEYGNKVNYESAKKQADYLLEIQDKQNGKFYYNYDFQVGGTPETLKSPWASAMAQGQVISLFVRIYNETKDEKYLNASILAMESLRKNVSEGGLTSDFFGHPYYEEYPTQPASYTLNGFMFTLIGLYDLYAVTGNEVAGQLYKTGINTLEFALPFYDCSGVSLYHLGHLMYKTTSLFYLERYHLVHIIELRTLNQIENSDVLKYYADKWEGYVKENK